MQNKPIVIKDGDEGEVLRISDLDICIPKQPPLEEILFSDLPDNEQKWSRTEFPEEWEAMSVSEREAFASQEFDRRLNGLWFMNNGVPTYITGVHYYYINWCKIDVGYPDYRDRDRRFFTFWEACVKDPKSYGMVMVKHRREGASWKGAAMALYYITQNFNAHGGLLSKTGKDAKDLFEKVVYLFRGMPEFFQPIIDGTDNPKSTLSFRKPGERITKNNKKVSKSEALDSKIDFRNTRDNSYDSTKLKFFMSDEAGKWKEASLKKNWQIVRPCLTQGINIYGKCFMPSTVNEMTEGGDELKDVWVDSDVKNKDANGYTLSGLYRYFTPVYDGYEGFIDEYGNSVVEKPEVPVKAVEGHMIDIGSKEYFENRRAAITDTAKLSEEKRQYPFNPEEAFRKEGNTSIFDLEKIYQQLDYLEDYGERLITRGNFIWKNGVQDSEVTFKPDKTGKFMISWTPSVDDQNLYYDKLNTPGNKETIVAGCDPVDHDTTTDGRRSDAAAYVFKKFGMDSEHAHSFVCEYLARPPKVKIFYEDMVMMCKFYGCEILVENNKIGLINHFKERGYEAYLMQRPESTHTKFSRRQKEYGVPTTGKVVINAISDSVQAYIYDFVGYNEEGEIGVCYFDRLLKDWSQYEPENRTKYDSTIASGLALIAANKNVKRKEIEKKVSQPFVRRYDNSGNMSKLIS